MFKRIWRFITRTFLGAVKEEVEDFVDDKIKDGEEALGKDKK